MQNQFVVGDTVRITFRAAEGAKAKMAHFEGKVIALRGEKGSKTFTVRRVASANVAVERIFPLDSPHIANIKVIRREKVRRANLYYLRKK